MKKKTLKTFKNQTAHTHMKKQNTIPDRKNNVDRYSGRNLIEDCFIKAKTKIEHKKQLYPEYPECKEKKLDAK